MEMLSPKLAILQWGCWSLCHAQSPDNDKDKYWMIYSKNRSKANCKKNLILKNQLPEGTCLVLKSELKNMPNFDALLLPTVFSILRNKLLNNSKLVNKYDSGVKITINPLKYNDSSGIMLEKACLFWHNYHTSPSHGSALWYNSSIICLGTLCPCTLCPHVVRPHMVHPDFFMSLYFLFF